MAEEGGQRRRVAGVVAEVLPKAELKTGSAIEEGIYRSESDGSPKRIVLRGGTIVSMDVLVGDLARGDLFIEGNQIRAIAPDLQVEDAEVIDARGMIVLPGFVDCHRHCWQGQLRLLNPNSPTLEDYRNSTHRSFARAYRPEDMYVGTYVTTVGCIDAGITTVVDNCHNSRSPEHSDAAIDALMESGIRAVHASGPPANGDWAKQWPRDLERLRKVRLPGDGGLVTLGMFSRVDRGNWKVARDLGLTISTEFQGPDMAALLEGLASDGLLGPENIFNHCTGMPDAAWQVIRGEGVGVNVCPRSDAQYALVDGICGLQRSWNNGIKPGLSIDTDIAYSGDMFAEMRVGFFLQRAFAQSRRWESPDEAPMPLDQRDMLHCATLGGAAAIGLADRIGSLTPGKQADVIMIRTGNVSLYPSSNAIGTVVQLAERGDIDTVIIGGRFRKFRGRIVGHVAERLRARVEQSRDYLFDAVGFRPDPFAQAVPDLSQGFR